MAVDLSKACYKKSGIELYQFSTAKEAVAAAGENAKSLPFGKHYVQLTNGEGKLDCLLNSDSVVIQSFDKTKVVEVISTNEFNANYVLVEPSTTDINAGAEAKDTNSSPNGPVKDDSDDDDDGETVTPPVVRVTATAAMTTRLGKTVSDLQSDVVIGDTAITGTLKWVEGYTGFSSNTNEQTGNYLAIDIAADPTTASTTCQLINGVSNPNPVQLTYPDDMWMVIRITDPSKQSIQVVSTLTTGEKTTKTYALTDLVLNTATEGLNQGDTITVVDDPVEDDSTETSNTTETTNTTTETNTTGSGN